MIGPIVTNYRTYRHKLSDLSSQLRTKKLLQVIVL